MKVVIEGFDLPGRSFCSGGDDLEDVHVGVQVRKDPAGLVRGDALRAQWELDVRVTRSPDGALDFAGPAVHGRRGERFLYLTWGNVDPNGHFAMFRRAKLILDRVDSSLVEAAEEGDRPLLARVRLSDDRGGPRCARVDPPDLTWSL